MKPLYTTSDLTREFARIQDYQSSEFEGDFSFDLSNLTHSACFRRLQGKTQLFPEMENDFFRNRLTHSIEVADIASKIAKKLNHEHIYFKNQEININLVRFAGLAHDLGHPPFGHVGERAINKALINHKNQHFNKKNRDIGLRYEGNAQTLRILSRLEKKFVNISEDGPNKNFPLFAQNEGIIEQTDFRIGLNLTYRSLASILKYDNELTDNNIRNKKGYYKSERDLVEQIKFYTTGKTAAYLRRHHIKFKTIECSIMDIADDISYTAYDLEDAFKGRFVNMLDFLHTTDESLIRKVISEFNDSLKKANNDDLYEKEFSLLTLDKSGIEDFQYILSYPFLHLGWIDNPVIPKNHIYRKKNQTYLTEIGRFNISSELYIVSQKLIKNGYFRSYFISQLIKYFIDSLEVKVNEDFPALSSVYLSEEAFWVLEALKQFIFISQTKSARLQIVDYRGEEIVTLLFDTLIKNPQLLPRDFRIMYENSMVETRPRIIADYISTMTNRYAIEFYARLKSENHQSIFKPF
ncbi:MAG: dNTP triphosphohydrolase [Sphingobacteriales bacterium]|nr:dNTP triphosphohydrolase [Sphingobacteriales bacterium]